MIDYIWYWINKQFETDTLKVYKQALPKDGIQTFIVVFDTGGRDDQWPIYKEAKIQIIVQAITDAQARQISIDVFNFISERYGETLSDGSSDLVFAKIKPIDRPIPLGKDGNGFQYSTNYEFLIL